MGVTEVHLDDLEATRPYERVLRHLRNPTAAPRPSAPAAKPLREALASLRAGQIPAVVEIMRSPFVADRSSERPPEESATTFELREPRQVARAFISELVRLGRAYDVARAIRSAAGSGISPEDQTLAETLHWITEMEGLPRKQRRRLLDHVSLAAADMTPPTWSERLGPILGSVVAQHVATTAFGQRDIVTDNEALASDLTRWDAVVPPRWVGDLIKQGAMRLSELEPTHPTD